MFRSSYHHQAIKTPGEGVRITAYSVEDGVAEAIEADNGSGFVVGVQWHPEMMLDALEHLELFKAFVNV